MVFIYSNLAYYDEKKLHVFFLHIIQLEFDIDKEKRSERENEMIRQLSEHEHLVEKKYEKQIVSRTSLLIFEIDIECHF